jgi:hypothetical protein
MSLAMFAAPFDDNNESTNNSENNIINKKRRAHTRTQKIYPKEEFDTNKVNNVLSKIHNSLDSDDDEDKDAFNPPPKSESAGVQKTIPLQQKEQMTNMTSNSNPMFRTFGRAPQPNYDGTDNLDLNDYSNYGDKKSNDEYYKRVIPGYNSEKNNSEKNIANRPYYTTANYNADTNYNAQDTSSSSDVLLQKLNYMITLLEEQQDERTNNVTEEVVLYSFLGIFIIFIADTFVRAGKYVR